MIRRASIWRRLALMAALLATACCGRQKPEAPVEPIASTGIHALPHVTLVVVTDWQSVLKPCGCTVDLQKGGIERIARAVDDLRRRDDSIVVVHAGALLADKEQEVAGRAAQLELRARAFVEAVGKLGMDAVALSSQDLRHGPGNARELYESAKFQALSAGWRGDVERARASSVITTQSGVRVGLIGIDPAAGDEAAWTRLVTAERDALRQQGAQVVVVLSNLGLRQTRRLARQVPGLDAVVAGGLPVRIDPLEDLERESDVVLAHSTRHGAYFSALTLAPRGEGPWVDASEFLPGAARDLEARVAELEDQIARWRKQSSVATQRALPWFEQQLVDMRQRLQRARAAGDKPLPSGRLAAWQTVGLPWSAPVDPELEALVARYDAAVAELNEKTAGTVPPVPPGQASYIGQAECLTCHAQATEFSKRDVHAHAWETLVDAEKTRDLDCVPCHVTAFGSPGGSALGKLEGFHDVQCEACHGPGSLHRDAPGTGAQSRLTPASAAVCETCHTPEHAPRFEFEPYRKRLLVPGHGLPLGSAK